MASSGFDFAVAAALLKRLMAEVTARASDPTNDGWYLSELRSVAAQIDAALADFAGSQQ